MMLIDDSVLHVINAFQAPGALGLYGVWRYFQRRNGNGQAKRSDIQDSEKRINRRLNDKFEDLVTRIENARGWIGDVEQEQRDMRNQQIDLVSRVAKCEGAMSKGKE